MLSAKLIYFFVIFIGSNLTAINGQFGFGGGPFFGGNSGGFNNQNTDFQQHRGGQFGVIAGFGSGGSSTSFNQNSGSGFSNFGGPFGRFRHPGHIFRSAAEGNDELPTVNHEFRYASPYDVPRYERPQPAYAAHKPSYKPSPSVQCPQNLLVGCAPQVQYVPCQAPPPAPQPSQY